MAVAAEYFELTSKYIQEYGEKTLLLMQVGAFFEVYARKNHHDIFIGSNIADFSQICELAIVEKSNCSGIFMAGFKDFMLEKYLTKMQEAAYTIVVYEQDEAAAGTTRSCTGIYSPGTYFSNDSSKLTNNIACIWLYQVNNIRHTIKKEPQIIIGVSNIDIHTGKTNIFQYQEKWLNSPTTYDELERFLCIYHPSEIIIISNLSYEEIQDAIQYANIDCSLIHQYSTSTNMNIEMQQQQTKMSSIIQERITNCEKQTYQREVLLKFYPQAISTSTFWQIFDDNTIAIQALCFLLDFVYQHHPFLVSKIAEPVFDNHSNRLILANHSLKQLNIIGDHNMTGKYSSVLKFLNECITPMGKRAFAECLLKPTTNINVLQQEYDMIEYFLEQYPILCEQVLKPKLQNIKDLSKFERQICAQKITPKSFCILHSNLQAIQEIIAASPIHQDNIITNYLNSHNINQSQVNEYCREIIVFIQAHFKLELALNIEQTSAFTENFIRSGVDDQLDRQINQLNEYSNNLELIAKYLSSLVEKMDVKKGKSKKTSTTSTTNKNQEEIGSTEYVKVYETEKNNFSLICTIRRSKLLLDALPETPTTIPLKGISSIYQFTISRSQVNFEKQSTTNQSIVEPQIKSLCERISLLKNSLKELITAVYQQIVQKFEETISHKLQAISTFITLMDLLYTKASLARKYNYCKPIIEVGASKSFVSATKLRHCLIEQIQKNEIYIANDIQLGGNDIDGILLYGTNAVGKTSFIKSLGIAVIMAQAGLFVPCSSFIFYPYSFIFTRILGNDNIFKGLSTFAVEMSELRTILRQANKNSLVLGDELCSGTEHMSALSIFVAGIQELSQRKCSFIFATHLHEIAEYDEIKTIAHAEGACSANIALKHMSVMYDKEQDKLVYDRRLKDGTGDNMYGLEVCKSLQLPAKFLEAAYEIRNKYNPTSSSILSLKTSHFNSQKIVGVCEKCQKRMGTEVHHLVHQKESNELGIIETPTSIFHKNTLANLRTLCEQCHREEHRKN